MIGIIREHNLLTGYRFVLVEYLTVSLLFGALGAYYLAVARWVDAAVWLGIVANCLLIAGIAAHSLWTGEKDFGTLPTRRREFRRAVAAGHPHLARRTVLLVTVTFIPWALVAVVAAGYGRTAARPMTDGGQ